MPPSRCLSSRTTSEQPVCPATATSNCSANRVRPTPFLEFPILTMTMFTYKITSLYVAYVPELDLSAYGGCQDEALNNLTDEIRERQGAAEETGEERKLAMPLADRPFRCGVCRRAFS